MRRGLIIIGLIVMGAIASFLAYRSVIYHRSKKETPKYTLSKKLSTSQTKEKSKERESQRPVESPPGDVQVEDEGDSNLDEKKKASKNVKKHKDRKDSKALGFEEEDDGWSINEDEISQSVAKSWSRETEKLFRDEMGLGKEVLLEYQRLRESYLEDQRELLSEFAKYMEDEYGESRPSANTINEKEIIDYRIRNEYLEQVRLILGDSNFHRYNEFKEQFNQRIEQQLTSDDGDSELDLPTIDF